MHENKQEDETTLLKYTYIYMVYITQFTECNICIFATIILRIYMNILSRRGRVINFNKTERNWINFFLLYCCLYFILLFSFVFLSRMFFFMLYLKIYSIYSSFFFRYVICVPLEFLLFDSCIYYDPIIWAKKISSSIFICFHVILTLLQHND